MPHTPISNQAASGLVKLIIGVFVVQLLFIGYVLYQSYAGRVDLVNAQRRSCERGKLDRNANAIGWRSAQAARSATLAKSMDIPISAVASLVQRKPRANDPTDLIAIRKYDNIANGLEKRSRISCAVAFPKAGLLP